MAKAKPNEDMPTAVGVMFAVLTSVAVTALITYSYTSSHQSRREDFIKRQVSCNSVGGTMTESPYPDLTGGEFKCISPETIMYIQQKDGTFTRIDSSGNQIGNIVSFSGASNGSYGYVTSNK